MLGRGIFNPVDLQHADNPPLNPELLDLLGDEFAAMEFDIKKFLGEIALTSAYQRSYSTPGDLVAAVNAARARLASLHMNSYMGTDGVIEYLGPDFIVILTLAEDKGLGDASVNMSKGCRCECLPGT